MTFLPWAALALSALNLIVLLWWVLQRAGGRRDARQQAEQQAEQWRLSLLPLREASDRLERELRDEVSRSALATRQDLSGSLGQFQTALMAQQGDVARTQNEQIDTFRTQLASLQAAVGQALQSAVNAQASQAQSSRDAQDGAFKRFSDTLNEQLRALSESSERRLNDMRAAVEQRLTALQQGNEGKLEQMRLTVDEKLHATLEQRLGDSFKQVAERLEQVHRGLGEMQLLAKDVGSLNRVLNNVKTRGIFGEVQLAGLLEQVFTPEQYAANVETVPGSGARVEYAVKLPGRGDDGHSMWLPIDAKFPREDHERLLDAQERADAPAAEAAAKAIEARLRMEARAVKEKYIAAPHTTDFAILFLPTESLYAEALRRPGLMESLQRECKVMLAGPTTLLATLNSLQMGFRTLALERRSAEVWEVLGAVKTEFAKFGDVLAKTKKKLEEASNTIDQAQTRANVMARKLKSVEALPDGRSQALLPPAEDASPDEPAAATLEGR